MSAEAAPTGGTEPLSHRSTAVTVTPHSCQDQVQNHQEGSDLQSPKTRFIWTGSASIRIRIHLL